MSATEDHEGLAGVTFDSDGNRLVGVLYLAEGDKPKPTSVLLHGCPGLEKNTDIAIALRSIGHNALIFHYRGCWGSAGRYDLRTIQRDVMAAVGFLDGHPLVDRDRITAIGHSLGGWAAITTAAIEPRLKAVAVYASAIRLTGATSANVEQEFTRFLSTTPAEFAAQSSDTPDAVEAVKRVAPRPVLIVHGTDDAWVPASQASELAAAAGENSQYIEVDGANHPFAWHRAELTGLITQWLEAACG